MPYFVHAKLESLPEPINGYWDNWWSGPSGCLCGAVIDDGDRVWCFCDARYSDPGRYRCEVCARIITAEPPTHKTRAEAFEYLKTHCSVETHTVTFRASEEEKQSWHRRENERFNDGTYLQTPWHKRQQYEFRELHYVHLSLEDPGKVAYTPDEESGVIDKQIRLTPGRYLERFYKDEFSREEIAAFVAQCAGNFAELQIAKTTDEVKRVYRNGPPSCMGGSRDHTDQYWTERQLDGHLPCEVYATPGDLAVAWFGSNLSDVQQRCVVWPEAKIYTRVYGTGPLEAILKRAGYSEGSINGARLPRIALSHGRILCPYIDGTYERSSGDRTCMSINTGSDRRFVYVCEGSDGEYDAHTTDGYVSDQPYYDEDCDDEPEQIRCSHCRSYFTPDDDERLCSECTEAQFTCANCNRDYFGDSETATQIGGHPHCESCTDDLTSVCQDCNCSNTWIEANLSRRERSERERRNVQDLCVACANRYVTCEACDESYDPDDDPNCPNCNREPRPVDNLMLQLAADDEADEAERSGIQTATPRPIAEFTSGQTSSGTLREAMETGQWRIADQSGRCLLYYCRHEIHEGDLFLRNAHGFGYCRSCVDSSGFAIPARPQTPEPARAIGQIASEHETAF